MFLAFAVFVLHLHFDGVSSRTESVPIQSLWPLPRSVHYGNSTFLLSPDFHIALQNSSVVLSDAIDRYVKIIKGSRKLHYQLYYPQRSVREPNKNRNFMIEKLVVWIGSYQELQYGMDESYSLDVNNVCVLYANTEWGALRGLETFAQTLQWNGTHQLVQDAPISIADEPRFKWRGLMIDTSRHFVPISSLESILDGMSYDKLNTFHWHLTDAEAFAIEIRSFPRVTEEGRYSKTAYYSQADVAHIIAYAKMRGIRVIPELDTPGHTFSWGNAYPEIILQCINMIEKQSRSMGYPGINNVLFDITNSYLYEVLAGVMTEIVNLFPDNYMHLGGDEVSKKCIDEFPRIKTWMKDHQMNTSTYSPLINYYTERLMDIVKRASQKKRMLFWAEVFNEGDSSKSPINPKDAVIHLWEKANRVETIRKAVSLGFEVVVSSAWYLDQQVPAQNDTLHYMFQDTWQDFYNDDPAYGLGSDKRALQYVMGGEVCQWGEAIGPEYITSWLWPRTAAASERLWSSATTTLTNTTLSRLMTHNCRLKQRGIRSMGLRPDYCEL